MISKTSILHERDATFQSQWSFGVDETLLFEMCHPFKNELLKKTLFRVDGTHIFLPIQFCNEGHVPKLGIGFLVHSSRSFHDWAFCVDETAHFCRTTCFA